MPFDELDKMIKDNQEAKQILKQQQSRFSIQIQQEPIGQVRKSKRSDRKEKPSKESRETKYCIRCLDR